VYSLLQFLRTAAASFAAFGSLAALAWSFKPEGQSLSGWQWGFLAAAVLFFIVDLAVGVNEYRTKRTRSYSIKGDKRGINKFMREWIEASGRTAIYTRDMSWAETNAVEDLLTKKAGKGELTICLPISTLLTDRLRSEGAHVVTYSRLAVTPRSRFTIADYGRGDARVAIGITKRNRHHIEVFRAGTDFAFQLSEDLIDLIAALPKSAR
jgi:hypothetical protein